MKLKIFYLIKWVLSLVGNFYNLIGLVQGLSTCFEIKKKLFDYILYISDISQILQLFIGFK